MSGSNRLQHAGCSHSPGSPRSPHSSGFPRRRGFSMIELMVTIGMIAVLVAILMPAVGRARGQAKMTTCASQLHQIYAAAVTWKADHDQQALQAEGWRTTLKPVVQDLRIYNCPESNNADLTSADVAAGPSDAAGSPGTTGQTALPSGGTNSNSDLPAYSGAYFHVRNTGWDYPIAPGPWAHAYNQTPTGYDLGFEDLGSTGHGDDWKDVVVHVEQTGPDTITLTLLPLTKGLPGYTSDIMDSKGTVMGAVYRAGGTPAGATVQFKGTLSGVTTYDGSTAGTGTAAVAGTGTDSDYGINQDVRQIFGNPGKIFGMDYTYSVIQLHKTSTTPAGKAVPDDWTGTSFYDHSPGVQRPVFARHLGYANVVFGDGSVRAVPLTTPNFPNFNPATPSNAQTYFEAP